MDTLKQDLKEVTPSLIYVMHLYFKKQPTWPNQENIEKVMATKFDNVKTISANDNLASFALLDYTSDFEDMKNAPMFVTMALGENIKHPIDDALDRSQFWDIEDGAKQLDECQYQVILTDMMAAGINHLERANALMDFLEVSLELFQDADLVYFDESRKLLSYDKALNNPYTGPRRIMWGGCNARFFNIDGSNDAIIDTIGLNIFGISDMQYHFKNTVDPNEIIYHAYNTAIYQFEHDMPINNNETIDGINHEHWICRYEDSLIQPLREVLDINMLEFAAGNRD